MPLLSRRIASTASIKAWTELNRGGRVVRASLWRPGNCHIRLPDRLDLLETVAFDKLIERREHAVQQLDDLSGGVL